jgi:hypothetical protein
MSLRSKPLLQSCLTKLCLALILAARRSGPRRRYCPYKSLRSKPLLQSCLTKLCLALILAARRSGLPTPPRENRACRGPPGLAADIALISHYAPNRFGISSLSGGLAAFEHCVSAHKRAAPPCPALCPEWPVPHNFDAFGQTDNYFTSRAPAVNRDTGASCSALSPKDGMKSTARKWQKNRMAG